MPKTTLTHKYCPHCGEWKARQDFYGHKGHGAVGLSSRCKQCVLSLQSADRKANPEKYRDRDRERHSRRYIKGSAYRAAHLAADKVRMEDPEYRQQKLDYIRQHARRRRKDPAFLESERRRSREILARLRTDPAWSARWKEWWLTEHGREVRRGLNNRRRARLRTAVTSGSPSERLALIVRAGGRCLYCDLPAKLTLDHLLALSSGGTDTIDNLVPACLSCNSSKHAGDPYKWILGRRGAPALRRTLDFIGGATIGPR